jgi:hypothetical protein
MKLQRSCLLIFAVFIMSMVSMSRAADLTLFAGAANPGSLSIQGIAESLDAGPVYGVRAAFNFVPMLGMEHTFGFSNNFLFPSGSSSVGTAKGFVYNADLIVNIPTRHSVPYVTAGVGLLRQYGSSNLPVGTKLTFNYGGGMKFPRLLGPFGLRFDVRGYSATKIFTKGLRMLEATGGILISLN